MISNEFTFSQLQYIVLSWLSVLLAISGTIIVFREYRKLPARPLIYLELILLFFIPYNICHGLLFLVGFENEPLMILLFRVQMIFLFIVVFFLVFFIESLRADTPSPLILMMLGLGLGNGLVLSVFPESVQFSLEIGPYLSDVARIIFGIDLICLGFLLSIRISRFIPFVPRPYLKPALLFYFGCLSPILFPLVLISTKLSLVILGIEILSLAVGTFIVIIAILVDERVLRVLPFNVYRVSVINMNIGLSIFDVLFEAKQSGPNSSVLIPHLMTANFQFVQSVIHDTEKIRSIATDNYYFIFEAYKDIVAFVIADQTSMLIKSALKEFVKNFYVKFGENIDSSEISQYKEAGTLLDLYFAFLPSHKIVSIGS
ncbi:hypothetical protein CEE45_16480 [Candidatus Heimdallarchaeota archaeon B3_Heim]|nr:MAG: hypothetical protein CEE45_16480 [Candidatus Heimdallarchaeota archaeon B3_Heim]